MSRQSESTRAPDMTASPGEVASVTRHLLQQLWDDPDRSGDLPPLMLWGPPGVGKSTIIRELCAEMKIGFIDVRLAQREPVDIRGLPVPDGESVKWLPSSEWPTDPQSRGVILFDELTAADRMLQVAAYEFILDRRLGDVYRVPAGWYIMGAGNRADDRAVALSFSSALANRFCHMEVAPDLASWLDWAHGASIHPTVTAFLRFRPEALFSMKGDLERGWPSPRSWSRVSRVMDQAEGLGHNARDLLIHGLIGQGAAVEFTAFLGWAGQIGDVLGMLEGRAKIVVPDRADQRYAFCTALVHHLRQSRKPKELVPRFIKAGLELSSDFAAMAMVDAMRPPAKGQQPLAAAIMKDPHFRTWTGRHGQVFAKQRAVA